MRAQVLDVGAAWRAGTSPSRPRAYRYRAAALKAKRAANTSK